MEAAAFAQVMTFILPSSDEEQKNLERYEVNVIMLSEIGTSRCRVPSREKVIPTTRNSNLADLWPDIYERERVMTGCTCDRIKRFYSELLKGTQWPNRLHLYGAISCTLRGTALITQIAILACRRTNEGLLQSRWSNRKMIRTGMNSDASPVLSIWAKSTGGVPATNTTSGNS